MVTLEAVTNSDIRSDTPYGASDLTRLPSTLCYKYRAHLHGRTMAAAALNLLLLDG